MPNPAATQQWPPGNAAAGPTGGTKPTNEDPVVKWVREARNEATSWWTRKNFRPWQKVLIFVVGIWVAMGVFAEIDASSHRQLNVGHLIIFAAIGYGLYRMVQARSGSSSHASSTPFPASQPVVQMPPVNRTPPPVAQAQPLPQRDPLRESPTRRRWRYQTPVYNPGTPRERLTQLLGSMLLSAAVCAVAALVMMILRGEMPDSNQYAWLALSSTIGSWAILIPAKFWEGKRGDAALRRFVMLVVGLGFGLIVSALMSWLFVSLPYSHEFSRSVNSDFAHSFYAADGTPKPIAFLAYFGFLFVIPRWWRQADPMRSTRLSIWHTAVALFWAAVLSTFWPFPQPWGWMIAATIAISVQLASPWFSPTERSQMKSQAVGA